jgi:hypothetical protein
MTQPLREPEGDEVEIRIVGPIGDYALSLFAGFDHVFEPATTTVRGYVTDEHELSELCHRLRDTGLELVSLRRVPAGPTAASADEEDLRSEA